MAVALDEIIAMAGSSWQVRRRMDRLLNDLIAIAPAERAAALGARIERRQPPIPR